MASRITATVVAAEEVFWGDSGEVPLLLSFGRTWQETLNDTGTGTIVLANDDPALAALSYDDAIRFYLDGAPVFTMLVEGFDTETISPSEESGQITTVSGRGAAAMLDHIVVYPEGGANHLPVADNRLFFFGQSTFDDSGWQLATEQALYQDTTPNWNTGDPPEKAPRGWPDPLSRYIWNNLGTVNDAPQGTVYFRHQFALAATQKVKIYASGDNLWTLWLDGVQIMGEAQDGTTWRDTQHTDVMDLSAGIHTLAAKVTNTAPFVDALGAHPNPAFLMVYASIVNGSDGTETFLTRTDGSWRVTNYLANAPPVTAGQILDILFAEAQARGCVVPLTTFSDTNDSDGAAWGAAGTAGGPIYEFTVPIGDSMLGVLRSLSDTYIDFRFRYGAFIIDMWNKSAHLPVSPAVLISGYVDAVNGNLTELRHGGDGSMIRDNFLVKYQGGYFAQSRTGHGRRRREGSASFAVATLGEARQVADSLIMLLRDGQETVTAAVEIKTTSAWQFYPDALIADLVTVPERDGTPVQMRLVGMTVTEDAEGNPVFVPELDAGHTIEP